MNLKIPHEQSVYEFQGLYGPLQILEGKVQQVWALQDLQPGPWRTSHGRALEILQPGQWNRGAGPDFKEAIIRLDGCLLSGDVEIHLYREDWWRHGHHLDPAYNSVILHVVLFAGGIERKVQTVSGKYPDEWVMGPWMREDLESVSGGEPGLYGELVPELQEWLESDLPETIRERLKIGADRRLQQKVSMARCFLENFRWEEALHRMTLYYLGFPSNRKPFYQLAEAIPARQWADPEVPARIRMEWEDRIRWGIGRPANQALVRLRQYSVLNRKAGNWCLRLQDLPGYLGDFSNKDLSVGVQVPMTREIRRKGCFAAWRRWIQKDILGGILNKSLADRLWIDAFLPLLMVHRIIPEEEGAILWFHAYPGSFPDGYSRLLKLAGIQIDPCFSLCNGWIQGLLWVEDQLRLERVRSTLGTDD